MPKTKTKILISKDLQKEIKDNMWWGRRDSMDLEVNEGIDTYFDKMSASGFTEKSSRELLNYKGNRAYVEGAAGARATIKPGWLPVKGK